MFHFNTPCCVEVSLGDSEQYSEPVIESLPCRGTAYAKRHYLVPVPSRDKLGGGCGRKGNGRKKVRGGDGAVGTDSPGGVAYRRIVGASASVICTVKSRRWRAVMEEVDKGCSEFCVTVGTATRTAGILGPDLQNILRQSYDYLTINRKIFCKSGP